MFSNVAGSAILAYIIAAGIGVAIIAIARYKGYITTLWTVIGVLVSCLFPPYGSLAVIVGLLGYLLVKQLRSHGGNQHASS